MSVECIKKGVIVIYDRNISVITKWLLRNSWLARSLFDVVDTAKGYNHESEKRQEREEKKSWIHIHRCVTPLLPSLKFTTDSETKARAHVPIVAWRTIQWLWLTNPCGELTAQAWSHARPHLRSEQCLWTTAMGTGSIYSCQKEGTKSHCGRKILSSLSNRGHHCSVTWWMRKYVSGGEMAHCMKAFQEIFVMKLAHK